jgi:hypothetical protein
MKQEAARHAVHLSGGRTVTGPTGRTVNDMTMRGRTVDN